MGAAHSCINCVYHHDHSYLILYQGRQRKEIEQISQIFPDIRTAIFSNALIVKAVPENNLLIFVANN